MPAVPVPIGGEVITSAWGKTVADAINELRGIVDRMEPQRYSSQSDVTLVTGGAQNIPGCTFDVTLTVAENLWVFYTFDFDTTVVGAGSLVGVIQMDGVNQAGTVNGDGQTVNHLTLTGQTTLFPTPGVPHTIKMVAWKGGGAGTAIVRMTHTRLTYMRIPRALAIALSEGV